MRSMGLLEHRNIFKIAHYICPHFSLRNWGRVLTFLAENLVALVYRSTQKNHNALRPMEENFLKPVLTWLLDIKFNEIHAWKVNIQVEY